MCITEPFQAVSCFGTKHLCSIPAWHLKTYLYNMSVPFVFFILIFSSVYSPVFLASYPDCKEWGCCWFPPALLQTEALAAFLLSPLWGQRFSYFILSSLRLAPPDSCGMWYYHNFPQISNKPFLSDSTMLTDSTKPNLKLKKPQNPHWDIE